MEILVISFSMDDILITDNSTKSNDKFKDNMMQDFEMLDLGFMAYFLRMEIN